MLTVLENPAPKVEVQTDNLEAEFEALSVEVVLAREKLNQMETEFRQMDLRTTLPSLFQVKTVEIARQKALVAQLEEKFSDAESRLGVWRKEEAANHARQLLIDEYARVLEMLRCYENSITRSEAMERDLRDILRLIEH
jgi:hypothetical protein